MPETKIKLAVVILNWNGRDWLETFLHNVLEHSSLVGVEVIIADNHSQDDSIDWLKTNHPTVRIIELMHNYGFAGGYNKALAQVEAEYYCLLNSDVAVSDNWIQPILERFEAESDLVAIQPKIRAHTHPKDFEYAGASGGFMDHLGYPFCRGRIFDTLEEDKGQYDEPMDVFWATGAALFIRVKEYHASGGLDEGFFAHMEEIDLCWRLQNMGHRIAVEPKSVVYHVGGGSLSPDHPRKVYLNFRNNLLMMLKNLPKRKLFINILLRLMLDGAAAFQLSLSKGKIAFLFAVIRAHFAFYRRIPKYWKKRSDLPSHIELKTIYDKSIIWQYFVKGKKKFSALEWL